MQCFQPMTIKISMTQSFFIPQYNVIAWLTRCFFWLQYFWKDNYGSQALYTLPLYCLLDAPIRTRNFAEIIVIGGRNQANTYTIGQRFTAVKHYSALCCTENTLPRGSSLYVNSITSMALFLYVVKSPENVLADFDKTFQIDRNFNDL